jgi:predicted ribosome quality control (RQC) complex YloA/Tae2 family protein
MTAEITDQERIQFYSACRCYRQRDEETPSSTPNTKITWADWFASHWNETLAAYFARAKVEKLAARIIEFEERTYGQSLAKGRAEQTRELMRAERAKQMKKGKRAT